MSDADFTVDPDGLDALSRRLGEVAAGMQGMGVAVSAYDALDLGPDAGVLHALQDFTSAWSTGLTEISDDVTGLQERLAEAAGAYRGTEGQIMQAATLPPETVP